jgi:hypothetical protein
VNISASAVSFVKFGSWSENYKNITKLIFENSLLTNVNNKEGIAPLSSLRCFIFGTKLSAVKY